MEKGNTKQEILRAALNLFSVQGYEATSISQIADAVGIRKASLYSHFESKQDILHTLLHDSLEQYNRHSIFTRADWNNPDFTKSMLPFTPDAAVRMVQKHIRYILHDPQISQGRKMLVIEQFQNPEMAQLQTRQTYSDVMRYFTGMMQFLIRQGVLTDGDPELLAAQLCLPVSVWINLCDREPDREEEIMTLAERHIRQFFETHRRRPEPDRALFSAYRVRNIYGENYSGVTRHCREAARAVIVENGKILLSHETRIGQWTTPGGGAEEGESPEQCCIRETAEETGFIVRPTGCFLLLHEFYEDWKYTSYYFRCAITGQTDRAPTDAEIERGATPEWIGLDEATEIFSHHQDYAESDEERRGIYLREYLALSDDSLQKES